MLLDDVFDRFAAESPVSVMARAAFEHALPAGVVGELFAEHAERQYTRELLFSQPVDLMGLVVCRIQPSLNAAIRKRAADRGVTRQAVYAKVARTEPAHGAAAEPGVSGYHVASEVAGASRGLLIATPAAEWAAFARVSAAGMAKVLVVLAGHVRLAEFVTSPRGPKKPRPRRESAAGTGHITTARVLKVPKS